MLENVINERVNERLYEESQSRKQYERQMIEELEVKDETIKEFEKKENELNEKNKLLEIRLKNDTFYYKDRIQNLESINIDDRIDEEKNKIKSNYEVFN